MKIENLLSKNHYFLQNIRFYLLFHVYISKYIWLFYIFNTARMDPSKIWFKRNVIRFLLKLLLLWRFKRDWHTLHECLSSKCPSFRAVAIFVVYFAYVLVTFIRSISRSILTYTLNLYMYSTIFECGVAAIRRFILKEKKYNVRGSDRLMRCFATLMCSYDSIWISLGG